MSAPQSKTSRDGFVSYSWGRWQTRDVIPAVSNWLSRNDNGGAIATPPRASLAWNLALAGKLFFLRTLAEGTGEPRLLPRKRLIPKELSEEEQLSLRAEFRERLSRPLVARIEQWGKDLAAKTLGQSGLGRAIAYMQGLWPGLVRFLENPRIPLDNNGTERAIRGPVVGRKNFYGSRSRRGTEVAATFYTIFETAKALHLDPAEYLRAVVLKALASPGSVTLPADFHATT